MMIDIKIKKIPYYPDADNYIENQEILIDERVNTVAKLDFENETYQRIRFEFANYLNHNSMLRDAYF